MTNLTWTTIPTTAPAVSLWQGTFSGPVSSVSLDETSLAFPYTTYLMAFDGTQVVGFCMEYAGAGYTYQGSMLIASPCMTQVSPQTWQFSLTGDITSVVAGTYQAAGAPFDVTYTAQEAPQIAHVPGPVSTDEPGTLLLTVAALMVAALIARYPAYRFRVPAKYYEKASEVGAEGAVASEKLASGLAVAETPCAFTASATQ